MRRVMVAALASVVLTGAACSGEPSPPPGEPVAPTSTSTTPTSPAPESGSPAPESGSPAPGAPAADCLTGTYELDRFLGVGTSQTYGTGEGGDLTLSFTDDSYTLRGAGDEPVKLTLAGGVGSLTVDGSVQGTYTGSGTAYDFTVGAADGKATITADGERQTLEMDQVASVLAPDGRATVACNLPKMILVLDNVRLELSRP